MLCLTYAATLPQKLAQAAVEVEAQQGTALAYNGASWSKQQIFNYFGQCNTTALQAMSNAPQAYKQVVYIAESNTCLSQLICPAGKIFNQAKA